MNRLLQTDVEETKEEKLEYTDEGAVIKSEREALRYIPVDSAKHYHIVPLRFDEGGILEIGAIDPEDLDVVGALNFIATKEGIEYRVIQITEEVFNREIERYRVLDSKFEELAEEVDIVDQEIVYENQENVSSAIKDAPVIKLVDRALLRAVQKRASDIHFEPWENDVVVRYRIDGVLQEEFRIPKKVHRPFVARIKILSRLRLDESRRPQDGRFSSILENRRVDFRVAVFPTANGEKVIMRVLDKKSSVHMFKDLGLAEWDMNFLSRAINQPFGLVLVTGPTGSGKSTTLYSIIELLDKAGKNIVSLEDPIEYKIDGISQSEIRPEIGYSFATGLRSVLRGDPDIIFVGEIRDKETARLAVQAALTGHLVFSTLHTNTSTAAPTRLIDLGIDPFFVASTLRLVIAQRLVRLIKEDHKEEIKLADKMKEHITKELSTLPDFRRKSFPDEIDHLYQPIESDTDNGLEGRIGVFEVFNVSKNIEDLILKRAGERELLAAARKEGMTTLREDALLKGYKGKIPLSEINKVSAYIESEE